MSSFSNLSITSPTSQLILQPFPRFTYVTTHSPTPSVASPTSQIILQPFCCFTYVTAQSPILPLLHLRHSSFSNPSITSSTSQHILQPFFRFTYVTAHSPTLPSLHLRHSSFSNPSLALSTSQLILQPFFRLSYVTGFSLTSPGEPPWTMIENITLNNYLSFSKFVFSERVLKSIDINFSVRVQENIRKTQTTLTTLNSSYSFKYLFLDFSVMKFDSACFTSFTINEGIFTESYIINQ